MHWSNRFNTPLKYLNFIRYFHDTKNVYLLLEYLSGGELFKKMAKAGGFLSEETCRLYMRDIAEGLKYLHDRGVIHRDIKPENILIGEDGKLRLTDLGWAVTTPSLGPEGPGVRYTLCGTPEYLAPEMVAGTGHTLAVDLWALGVLLYEMLYGRWVLCVCVSHRITVFITIFIYSLFFFCRIKFSLILF